MEEALDRGNHKSARSRENDLEKLVVKDVHYGFQLPITKEAVLKIPHACLSPYSIVDQLTIDEDGNLIPKLRLAHDQSFPSSEGRSVNNRIDQEDLIPLTYGKCLSRILHYVHALRLRYPFIPIVGAKVDFRSAYRRANLFGHLAAMCLSVVMSICLVAFRLPFGGGYCPAKWCPFSEATCDLANAIMNHDDWDESELYSPFVEQVPEPIKPNTSKPLPAARRPDVIVELEAHGKADVFIDDIIPVGLWSPRCFRLISAVLLAMEIIGRPLNENDPLPREPLIALNKLLSEGGLDEHFIALGWMIDTRAFTVALTEDKFKAWSRALDDLIRSRSCTVKYLEETIGKLNWVAELMPLARYFLHRIRSTTLNKSRFVKVNLKDRHVEDLKLWKNILTKARKGISINNLVERSPDHIFLSDACEHGIGGFSYTRGWAWRYEIPADLLNRATINFLEWLAMMVNVKLGFEWGDIGEQDCILPMGDSTSAIGWLFGVSFDERHQSVHQELARDFVYKLYEEAVVLYSQHLPGLSNILADSLSRDHHLDDQSLTKLLTLLCPSQLPQNFKILRLPRKITSFISSTLARLPKRQQELPHPTRSIIGRGRYGTDFWHGSNLRKMCSSTQLAPSGDQPSSEDLLKLSEMATLASNIRTIWRRRQSERPLENWVRSSGLTEEPTQQ